MDITEFYQTFFEEADELLAEMEQLLLGLNVDMPDSEHLNAIFRAVHSIKGGAATFGFVALTDTTHLLENLLDRARHRQLTLRKEMIDVFLEAKDVLQEQLGAYRAGTEPDPEMVARICVVLKQLAEEDIAAGVSAGAKAAVATEFPSSLAPPAEVAIGSVRLKVCLSGISESDRSLLTGELANLGEVVAQTQSGDNLVLWLETTCEPDDIIAVCCFIIDMDQINISQEVAGSVDAALLAQIQDQAESGSTTIGAERTIEAAQAVSMHPVSKAAVAAASSAGNALGATVVKESSSIRVDVEKVDLIINLVGELVITQSMLAQTASTLDPVMHERLLSGMGQLQRNARDLQEAVMSIRMMQMDYVFSRFPRLVRDLTAKLRKEVRLVTFGKATELDKSQIERIVDPLMHLVRNSLDHGIETPEERIAAGKDPVGEILLSAHHQGGNIVIEVSDDGAGLNREKILAKAIERGMLIGDAEILSDDEVWQMIFAPGFSTADKVTDISGRGVGMDVVKENIQDMGGHVEISSRHGSGSTIKIVLPLTLAILDGMSVKVGNEVYILPLNYVIELLQPRAEDIHCVTNDEQVMHVRGEYLPLTALHRVFDVADARRDPTKGIVVIVQAEGQRFALLVDQLVGQHQVVVKNLETNYRKVAGISAATILGDGSVALIVDVPALQRAYREKSAALVAA